MNRKIKIKSLPQLGFGGTYGDQTPPTNRMISPRTGKKFRSTFDGMRPDVEIRKTLLPTKRENATLEAELGETVVTNLQKEGIPEFYRIGGKRHYKGGTPLNLPENSFVFSRDKAMSLEGDAILAPFGKSGNKPYTPAELSKQYDINFYRQILASPYSDKLQRETAEMMIKNYNLKLGALALAQESIKGFDDGIPLIAVPYMEYMGITPDTFMGTNPEQGGTQPQQFRGGGEQKNSHRILIKQLNLYQDGGEKPITEKQGTTRIPKGTKWDVTKEGYDESLVQKGDYIRGEDGLWREVTGFKPKGYKGSVIEDERLGEYQQPYSMLVEEFKKKEIRDAFWKHYLDELNTTGPRLNLSKDDIAEIKKKGPDDAIRDFLYLQKINLALDVDAKKKGVDRVTEDWDQDANLANKKIKELDFKPVDNATLGSFQIGYNGFVAMKDDPEDSQLIKNWMPAQIGVYNDERTGIDQYGAKPAKAVSKVDAWYGNTTAGQIVLPANVEQEMELKEWAPDNEPDIQHFKNAPLEPPAKWWTQDLVNLSDAITDYLTIPENKPWNAPITGRGADPTFTDFRLQAARAQAMANTLANANATFAGPQAQAATYAGLQANSVDPMTQLQQAEIAANVQTANQFAQYNNQVENNLALQRAANATNLWDKNAIYNQQLSNTKAALKDKMLAAFNQGWTNRGLTQSMNTRTDQYKVDPRTGYTYYIGDNRVIKPDNSSQTTFSDQAALLKSQFPEMDWKDAINLVKLNAGLPVTDDDNIVGNNAAQFMYPGYLDSQN